MSVGRNTACMYGGQKLQRDCSRGATYNVIFGLVIMALALFVPELELSVRALGFYLGMTRLHVAKLYLILAGKWGG